jgi:small-conductance mechanosensitive channel
MNAADSTLAALQRTLAFRLTLGGFSVTVGGVLAAALTLVVVWVLSRVVQRGFDRYATRHHLRSRAAIYTLSRIATYTLVFAGLMVALGLLGIPVSRFAVLAGAVGVGLGFGLQAIFSNFVSGIILLFDRSLRVGDFVELESGLHGEVRAINIRATRITTNDNVDILVPNSEFVTGRVVNWTHGDLATVSRRLHIPFGVAYGFDKELVKKAALEAAEELPFTLAREGPRRPQVWLVRFGESSLDFELVVWLTPEATKRPGAVRAAYLWALETALTRHGIEIPVPQRDFHLRTLFGLQGEAALAALRGQTAAPAGEEPPELSSRERRELARNDAVEEIGRAEQEEAERRAAEERDAAAEAPAPGGD